VNKKEFETSLLRLHLFCEHEKYLGYSLYDSHTSPIPFSKLGKLPSFLINQAVKRSPVNFRPLIGVKKGINPKGYGLFLHAYSLLSESGLIDKTEAIKKAEYFYRWLIENPSRGYSGMCWGYNYLWPKKDGNDVPPYMPSIVVTGFVSRALIAWYENTGNGEVKRILKSAAEFVLNDVHLYRGKEGFCFSYTPVKKDLTINANLLAAEVLAYADHVHGENRFKEYIREVIAFTMNHQNEDGSWYYSFDYKTRKPKKQIDFHQGYVIESLQRLYTYSGLKPSEKEAEAVQKGLRFYYEYQFNREGLAYWRLPSKWPVDIHNQSQGIITFARFKDYDPEYLPFAKKIAAWTVLNMQNRKGNFYYQKWPMVTNKVNYLRWNQGWMLLALTTLHKHS